MTLDKKELTAQDAIKVTVKLKNSGDKAGKEVVQLYLRDKFSSAVRPVQELIAFEKVHLDAGEYREVTFNITEPMLRYWNASNEFVSEPGAFSISVGYADHMTLTEEFTLIKQ